MRERWRKPIVPLEIEHHPSQVLLLPDGRQLGDQVLMLSPEDVERLRTGYACAKCFEPFERAWPVRCPVCGAPVRAEQSRFFAQEVVDKPVQIGPTTSLEEERAGIYERARKEEEANGNGPDLLVH